MPEETIGKKRKVLPSSAAARPGQHKMSKAKPSLQMSNVFSTKPQAAKPQIKMPNVSLKCQVQSVSKLIIERWGEGWWGREYKRYMGTFIYIGGEGEGDEGRSL